MRFSSKDGAMPFFLYIESDRQITAGALRLYAEDYRKFAGLDGALAPAFRNEAIQAAERLADEIGRTAPVEIGMDRNGAGEIVADKESSVAAFAEGWLASSHSPILNNRNDLARHRYA